MDRLYLVSVYKLPSQSELSFRRNLSRTLIREPESRVPGENRDPVFDMVPDFRRDDVWMPPYQVRGRLLKSGMTEKAVYGQPLNNSLPVLLILHIMPISLMSVAGPITSYRVPLGSRVNFRLIRPFAIAISISAKVRLSLAISSKTWGIVNSYSCFSTFSRIL